MQDHMILEAIKIKVNYARMLLEEGEIETAKKELESILRVIEGVLKEKLYEEIKK